MPSHNEVAKRWVLGEVSERGLQGHHMFASPTTIYSYGYHFPIATRDKSGCILFATDGYSVSTAKHKGIVRRQLIHHAEDVLDKRVFSLPHAVWKGRPLDHKLALQHYADVIVGIMEQWQRARKNKWFRIQHGRDVLADLQRYCAFHKLKVERAVKRNPKLAVAIALFALNPGG